MGARASVMREVAEAFEKANLQPLFDVIAETIVWKSGATNKDPFLFGGTHKGLEDVLEVTIGISMGYVFQKFVPKEIVGEGDILWGLFYVEGHYKPPDGRTRKQFNFECAIRWRMHGEKVVEHQAFFDTHGLLQQQS